MNASEEDIFNAYFIGKPDLCLDLLGDSRLDDHIVKRLEGLCWSMKGNNAKALDKYSSSVLSNTSDQNIDKAWKFALEAKIAYYKIQPVAAKHYADSARFFLEKEKDYAQIDFLIWTIILQSEKQYIGQERDKPIAEIFNSFDSLADQARMHMLQNGSSEFCLAQLYHVIGNSYTDRVFLSKDNLNEQEQYLDLALESYEQETEFLESIDLDHPNIATSILTKILAYKYAATDTETMSFIYRESLGEFFPFGPESLPTNKESALMYLMQYTDFLLEAAPDHPELFVEEEFKLLNQLAHRCWKSIVTQKPSTTDHTHLAIYSLIPHLNDLRFELMNATRGLEPNLETLVEMNQFLKFRDVFNLRSNYKFQEAKPLHEIQNSLKAGDVALDFINPDDLEVSLLCITHDSITWHPLPKDFIDKGNDFVDLLSNSGNRFHEEAYSLYQELESATHCSLLDANRIFVSYAIRSKPFPLEALITERVTNHTLYTDYPFLNKNTVVTLPSLAFFESTPIEVEANIGSRCIQYHGVDSLAFTSEFESSMQTNYSKYWTTHNGLLSDLFSNEHSVYHISGHGIEDTLRTDRTILKLTEETGSFNIEALESSALQSSLVIINICNSGSGGYIGLNGVSSPARDFLESGADGVIANNWSVDDQTSHNILKNFYSNLINGENSVEAIAKAKENYLNECSNPSLAHPYYWAATSYLGNGVQIKSQEDDNNSIVFTLLFLSSCLILCYFWLRNKKH